jgi:hypothetical protein
MPNYIKYTITNPSYEVVADLFSDRGEVLFRKEDIETILDYKGDTTFTNRQRILNKFSPVETEDVSKLSDEELPVSIGDVLLIPKSVLDALSEATKISTSLSDDGNDGSKFNVFVNDIHKKLLADSKYRSITKLTEFSSYIDFFPKITVFLWSRTLNKVINISPFIQTCVLNSAENATSFQITLPPILASYENDEWAIDKSSIEDYSDNYNARSSLFKSKSLKESDFYFHRVISQNDLVFIQFETLENETKLRSEDSKKFDVGYDKLPKRIYDVIGAVDTNDLLSDPQNAEIGIQISGRDLTKFLIDDGTYFWYEELLGTLIPDRPENAKLRGRIYGSIPELNGIGFRDIKTQLDFVFKLFFITGYYPNEIFEHWENRNTITTTNTKVIEAQKENIEAQKEYVIDLIQRSREFYGLSSANGEDEVAESILNNIVARIESNTLVTGQNILTQDSLIYFDNKIYKREQLLTSDVDLTTASTSGNFASAGNIFSSSISYTIVKNRKIDSLDTDNIRDGLWQIFDIEVDPSIANVRLYDTKLNESNGSILASIQAIVEEPFMEIFTDTYGDRFKLIARRQPFDAKYYNELVDETVIDIDASEVISTQLGFADDETYTWYYLQPNGMTYGESLGVAFIKAVILPEYVDVWGSRPYNKQTNYAPFITKKDIDSKINTDLKQAIYDLKFMIDINAYNPFVRKGTIVINGNRTIKKKQAIRLKQTGEIFHVDTVQNTYVRGSSIDRTTVLQVSRGMIEHYMTPRSVGGVDGISYFNIVDTTIKETDLKDFSTGLSFGQDEVDRQEALSKIKQSDYSLRVTQDWKVNKEVFDFFLKKKQFSPQGYSEK